MDRLDYRITENGMARRATAQEVIHILATLYPAIAEEIDREMIYLNKPFDEFRDGRRITIEYKGPKPREVTVNKMNLLSFIALLLTLTFSACQHSSRMTGGSLSDEKTYCAQHPSECTMLASEVQP